MHEFVITFFSKPFLGLIILVRLFGQGAMDSANLSISSLKLVQISDSVFVHAEIRNGLTAEIKKLLSGGVSVRTSCDFRCGHIAQHYERTLQYNPVKRSGCELMQNGSVGKTFKGEEMAIYFNQIEFYVGDLTTIKRMRAANAHLTIATTTKIETMQIGDKALWPEPVVADFVIPELTGN